MSFLQNIYKATKVAIEINFMRRHLYKIYKRINQAVPAIIYSTGGCFSTPEAVAGWTDITLYLRFRLRILSVLCY